MQNSARFKGTKLQGSDFAYSAYVCTPHFADDESPWAAEPHVPAFKLDYGSCHDPTSSSPHVDRCHRGAGAHFPGHKKLLLDQ